MSTYLIDFENVKSAGLTGIDHIRRYDSVHLFWSTRENKISIEMMEMIRASESEIVMHKAFTGDRDALDHQLCSYLGFLAGSTGEKSFVIVSNDKAYDHLIEFWKRLDEEIQIQRVPEISRISEAPENDPALIEAAREAAEAVFERERHYEETHGRYGRRRDRSGRYLKATRSRLNKTEYRDNQSSQEEVGYAAEQRPVYQEKEQQPVETVPEKVNETESVQPAPVQTVSESNGDEGKNEGSGERSEHRRSDNIRGRRKRQGRNSRHQNTEPKNEEPIEVSSDEAVQKMAYKPSEVTDNKIIEAKDGYGLEKAPVEKADAVSADLKDTDNETEETQITDAADPEAFEEKAAETEPVKQEDTVKQVETVSVKQEETTAVKADAAVSAKTEEPKLRRPLAAVVVTGFRSGIVVESGFTADGILDKPSVPVSPAAATISPIISGKAENQENSEVLKADGASMTAADAQEIKESDVYEKESTVDQPEMNESADGQQEAVEEQTVVYETEAEKEQQNETAEESAESTEAPAGEDGEAELSVPAEAEGQESSVIQEKTEDEPISSDDTAQPSEEETVKEMSEASVTEETAEKTEEPETKRKTRKNSKTSENGKKRSGRRKKQPVKQEDSEQEILEKKIPDAETAVKEPAAGELPAKQEAPEADQAGDTENPESAGKNKPARPRRGRPPKKDKAEAVSEKKAEVTEADVIAKYPEAAQAAWTKDLVRLINQSKDKKELYAATVKLLGQENGRNIYHEIKVLK